MKKIAVIEDNLDNRILVRALLEEQYEVIEYDSGPAALEGMKEVTPDLILLDISMPEMDGVQVIKLMRLEVKNQNIPVIALTAHAMVGDREKYMALGFNDYVAKPITDETMLTEAIRRCLDQG